MQPTGQYPWGQHGFSQQHKAQIIPLLESRCDYKDIHVKDAVAHEGPMSYGQTSLLSFHILSADLPLA